MSKSNENNPHIVLIPLGSPNADKTVPALYARKKMVIKKATLLNGAGIAADATNKLKVQLKNGSTLLAEWNTEAGQEGALSANVGAELPESEIEVAAGSSLTAVVDVSGTIELTDALLQLELYKV